MKNNFSSSKKPKIGFVALLLFFCVLWGNGAMAQKTISYSTTPVDANFATTGNWNHTSTFGLAATNTLGTDLITLAVANSTISVGDLVSGTGVPLGATIIGIDGAQTGVTISAVTTAAVTSVSFTFATPLAGAIATVANNTDVTSLTADITYNVESGNTYFQRRLSNLSTSAADMTLSGAGTIVLDVNEDQFYTFGGWGITHQSASGTKFNVNCKVRFNNTFTAATTNRNNVLRCAGNAANILEFGSTSEIENVGFGAIVSYPQSGTILFNGVIKPGSSNLTCGIGNTTFGPTSDNSNFTLAANWMNVAAGANVTVNTTASGNWYKNTLGLLRCLNYAAGTSSTITLNTANVWNSPLTATTNTNDRLTGVNLVVNANQTSNTGALTLGLTTLQGILNLTVAPGVSVSFGNSSAITWTLNSVINIYGFDTAGDIRFGTSATGLSAAQLAVIILKDGANAGKAVTLDATGKLIVSTLTNTWIGTTATYNTVTNWSLGIVPTTAHNVVIPAVVFPALPPVMSSNGNMFSLTVNSGATLSVNSGFILNVSGKVTNNGTINLFNNGLLFQRYTSTNDGSGVFNVSRTSNSLKRLDFTMWSSPVTGTQTLADFSPLTSQSPSRFYTYDSANNEYDFVASPTTTTFATGTGYLIRMPNTNAASGYDAGLNAITFTGRFTGNANNSPVQLTGLTPDKFYAVGNPYPTPISGTNFLTLNQTGGTLYFFRKTNAVANSTGSAYATWTTLGGTAADATAPNNNIPTAIIQIGQGFIVKTGLTATSLTFNHAMKSNSIANQWFFKTKQEAEPDRVWLNLTSPTGVFSQTLVGYTAEATLGFDNGYDGEYINDSPTALTSNIDNKEYTIQARPAFDATDIVALNFKTNVAGDYNIALGNFDGLFAASQDVYLMDSKTGTETNLKAVSYNFKADAGVDNTRFTLKYQKTLSIDTPSFDDNSIMVYANNGTLYVNSKSAAINNVTVYDIQGRLIAQKVNVKSTTAVINNLRAINQILIVRIEGEDSSVVTKKLLN
jgi:hypothetical protein